MAQIHEINFAGLNATGSTAPVPQYTFNVNIKWTDDNGNAQEHTGTYTWPNILSQAPNGWLRRTVIEHILTPMALDYLGIQPLED